MRHVIELSRKIEPIRGGYFTFRTFADGEFGKGRSKETGGTLDRLVTVTLPAIDGEDHKIVPHMEVVL